MTATRKRHFRFIRVELECGHFSDLNTGRYRVSADVREIIVQHAVRSGVWCHKCNGNCLPVKSIGVFRGD